MLVVAQAGMVAEEGDTFSPQQGVVFGGLFVAEYNPFALCPDGQADCEQEQTAEGGQGFYTCGLSVRYVFLFHFYQYDMVVPTKIMLFFKFCLLRPASIFV